MRTFASDGTSRLLKRAFAHDGTAVRAAKRIFVADGGGVARLVFSGLTLTNFTSNHQETTPTDSYCGVGYNYNGAISEGGGPTSVFSLIQTGNWAPTAAGHSEYDMMATVLSGSVTFSLGSAATWTNMASSNALQFYTFRTNNSAGINTATVQIDVRPAGGGATLATCVVTLQAEVTL